ncbi:hypothetical protein AB0M95_02090 [Sphaerisporangium sp. NPDC051017]|uniref:hypothetical protein n=1 Tax=Sphaerisporangium sp. NPDC051017 TaxID=3154636 RepID=UPI003439579C
MSAEHGGEGVGLAMPAMPAMLAKIDTLIARTPGLARGMRVRLVWQDQETKERTDIAEIDPVERRAGQLIAARVADDRDTFRALVQADAKALPGIRVNAADPGCQGPCRVLREVGWSRCAGRCAVSVDHRGPRPSAVGVECQAACPRPPCGAALSGFGRGAYCGQRLVGDGRGHGRGMG